MEEKTNKYADIYAAVSEMDDKLQYLIDYLNDAIEQTNNKFFAATLAFINNKVMEIDQDYCWYLHSMVYDTQNTPGPAQPGETDICELQEEPAGDDIQDDATDATVSDIVNNEDSCPAEMQLPAADSACPAKSEEDTGDYNYKYYPKNGRELKELMKKLIEERGNNGNFNDVYTGMVNNMRALFWGRQKFNGDITKWDTSNVNNMSRMFNMCSEFDRDLSKWDVRCVEDSSNMFSGCKKMIDKHKPVNTNTMKMLG